MIFGVCCVVLCCCIVFVLFIRGAQELGVGRGE